METFSDYFNTRENPNHWAELLPENTDMEIQLKIINIGRSQWGRKADIELEEKKLKELIEIYKKKEYEANEFAKRYWTTLEIDEAKVKSRIKKK